MLFKKDISITSVEAKIALKTIHVLIGYVFSANLLFRIIWGFIGNPYARWSNLIPGHGYRASVRNYLTSVKEGTPTPYAGHNPLGQMAVIIIFITLITLAITGLVRAGTDIYYPPFGSYAAKFVAKPGTNPDSLIPYDKTGVDEEKLNELKNFKKPIGTIHIYTSYFLMFLIVIHIAAVVRVEIKEGGGIISAMFTGKKYLSEQPLDKEPS